MTEVVTVDRPTAHVIRLLINRPDKRNAVDWATRQALHDALIEAQGDPACRAIILGGVGGVFSAGGDLPSMVGMTELQARERMRHGHQLCKLVIESRVPIVSAAEGVCAGAVVGLALLGDAVVAGDNSRFLFPFLRLGLVPDWGLLHTVPARIGLGAARRLFTSGRALTGEEAARIGLVDQHVADRDVMAAAVAQAAVMALWSPRAYLRMKRRLLEPSANLSQEFQREEEDQSNLFIGPDFREGYAAYAEKRDPIFDSPHILPS
jgi:2-(1,2-epoxy-1,2-dihydrophenyl)acetyl-CoA isomerase